MPQPCIGSSCSALRTSMSSVPCRRSPFSLATFLPSRDERRLRLVPFERQGEAGATGGCPQSNQLEPLIQRKPYDNPCLTRAACLAVRQRQVVRRAEAPSMPERPRKPPDNRIVGAAFVARA